MSAQPMPRGYFVINSLIRRFFYPLLMPVTVRGQEHVPLTGPLIVVFNHFNITDAPMLGAYFPRELVMLSKIENFNLPIFGRVVKAYGALPVRRGEADVEAIKASLRLLRAGSVLLIAPEGTRGEPVLRAGHDGAALLATRANVPIVPVGVAGHERLITNLKRLRRTPATLSIGPAFRLEGPPRPDRETLHAMTAEIMERIAAQLPPIYHGPYQPQEGAGRFARPLAPDPH